MDTNKENKYVAYYRVSTQQQGASGLGLEAQKAAVSRYISSNELVGEFTEIETGKGAKALQTRPQLSAALSLAKISHSTLLVAKLDRLARNVHFISGLIESGVKFVALDMPMASTLTLHVMAAFAEHEAKMISERTKAALAAAKARGVILGAAGSANIRAKAAANHDVAIAFAISLKPILEGFGPVSQREMVALLNTRGIPAFGGGLWSLSQLQRVLSRLRSIS